MSLRSRATTQHDPSNLFEQQDHDVTIIFNRAENQTRETLRPSDLSELWLTEKILKVQKKFRENLAGKVLFRLEIKYDFYLGQAKFLDADQKARIVSLFKEIF